MGWYLCIKTIQFGGKLYEEGKYYLINSSPTPPAGSFTAKTIDQIPRIEDDKLRIDRDLEGTHHILNKANFEKDVAVEGSLSAPAIATNCIDFDVSASVTTAEGRLCWDGDEDSLAVGMPGGEVNLNVGMEAFLPRRVSNKSGGDLKNGNYIYISGGSGVNAEIEAAQADVASTAETTIACLTEDIDDNGKGYATTFGLVRGSTAQPIDTSSFPPGTVLYLSPTVPGGFQDTVPPHPNYVTRLGQVFRQHGSEGWIFVNIGEPVCPCRIAGGDDAVWDDLRFPASRIRQGATAKPDFDVTNLGLLFPQDDATEIAYIIGQMPHEYLLESDLEPHIHFFQEEATTPTFKLDYRWYKNGADPTGSFTTITAATFAFTYTSGTIMQIASFPSIDATGIDSVSSIIDIKLYRDDDDISGDVLLKEFDIHYKIDSLGSRQQFTKG